MLAGQLVHPLLEFGRPVHRHGGSELICHGRVGTVGGERQVFGQARQRFFPVRQLCGDRAVGVVEISQLGTLPQRVIDVLHRQGLPIGGLSPTPARVGHTQIAHQRAERPPVGGDVVHHRNQHVLMVGNTEKICAQRDFGRQIEGVPNRGIDGFVHGMLRPTGGVDDVPAEVDRVDGCHHLPRNATRRVEHRTQALMARHHVGQGGAKRIGIEVPVQLQAYRHVVHRRRPLQLVDEPQPVLRERQRNHRGSLAGHQRCHPR
nr:hypothetical protein CPGR_06024 [Mycolicibacterium fortuitum subsp. fortuitum DSM 46621 = ATCC 6841 = JCM 6387]